MKKRFFYGLIIILFVILAGCSDSEEQSDKTADKASDDETKETTEDNSELTEQLEKELDELDDGLPRDAAEFLLEEFGETANVDSTLVSDDFYILDKREADGKLMRFYEEPRHLVSEIAQYDDDGGETNGLSVNMLGDIEADSETTYIERLKDTKKILDFLFAYSDQEYDIHTVIWSYPIKGHAAMEQYGSISSTIIAERITREQYENEWESVDFDHITMDEIRDMENTPIVDNSLLYPFTDRLDRHDVLGQTYEVNDLSVTLEEAERLDEYDGVSIDEFCAAEDEDRSCNSFIKANFVIKNDRDYDMAGFSTFLFGLSWTMDDGQIQETSPLTDTANGFDFPNLEYDIFLPSGEERAFEVVFADYNDVEHVTINFNNYVFDEVNNTSNDSMGPMDQDLNLSWLLEEIL